MLLRGDWRWADPPAIEQVLLLGAVAVQALAFGIWVLDLKKLVCAPERLLQGHAVWHLLGALASDLLWPALRA